MLVALAAAVLGAVFVETVRMRGRASGDIALAIIFYGGIAGGVVLISKAPGGSAATLNAYLFGAITTTTAADLTVFAVLAAVILVVTVGLARRCSPWRTTRSSRGRPACRWSRLNLVLAVLTASTIVLSMRVIGLLLISALMVVPVATAILVTRSFRSTMAVAVGIGMSVSVLGVVASYSWDTPSGGTIVLLAIALFALLAGLTSVRPALRRRR